MIKHKKTSNAREPKGQPFQLIFITQLANASISLNTIAYASISLNTKFQWILIRGSRNFCQRGPIILVNEEIEDPNITINGPSSACQRNAILMSFRWRADDSPTMNVCFFQGTRTCIANNPKFCDFSGGGPDPLYPPLDPSMILYG